jgi:hypothetical protein
MTAREGVQGLISHQDTGLGKRTAPLIGFLPENNQKGTIDEHCQACLGKAMGQWP